MNKILFYDTETTGLPDWKVPSESEHQPHIVQLAAIVADLDARKIVSSMNVVVKPDGWDISAEMVEIHGITTELAGDVGVPEAMAFNMLMELWGGCTRVAHNRTFDQRIVRIAAKRYSDETTVDRWADKETHHCSMLLAKDAMGVKKWPKLEEAYAHFTALELVGAHNALVDVEACMTVYWAILDNKNKAEGPQWKQNL